jgi:hypothetical protein
MKTNYLLLSTFFLFFLFGCNTINTETIDSDVEITPPDDSGLVGITAGVRPGFLIEYLDKEVKPYLLLAEGKEEHIARLNDRMEVEFISFIDEITGRSFLTPENQRIHYLTRNYFGYGGDLFEYYDLEETIRHYIFKYKVPSIKGESVEEIKAIFHYFGGYGKFTDVWYNGKKIPITDIEEIKALYPPEDSPDRYDREVHERIMKETYYSGKLMAIMTEGSGLEIIIPVE